MNPARTATTAAPAAAGYLRKQGAAKYLSVSTRTITDWMRRGLLPYSKPARKVCLFAVADLEKAIRRFRVESGAVDAQGRNS